MSRSYSAATWAASDSSSRTSHSTGRPSRPPASFRRSTNISPAILWIAPVGAKAPVSDRVEPTTMGSPLGVPAAPAVGLAPVVGPPVACPPLGPALANGPQPARTIVSSPAAVLAGIDAALMVRHLTPAGRCPVPVRMAGPEGLNHAVHGVEQASSASGTTDLH